MMHCVQTIGTIEEIIAPPFTLPSAHDRTPVCLYAFRQKQPVGVLFIAPSADAITALRDVTQILGAFRQAGAALLVITRKPMPDVPLAPIVLVDRDGDVFRRYECADETICLFGLDRYGAVVHRSTCGIADLNAALRALLDAIEFSEMQCPE